MVFFDPYGDRSALGFGAVRFHFAPFAIFHREFDLDHLIVVAINRWRPADTLSPSWTRRFLSVPINGKTTGVKALLLFRLPFVVSSRRRDEIDAVILPTLDKLL